MPSKADFFLALGLSALLGLLLWGVHHDGYATGLTAGRLELTTYKEGVAKQRAIDAGAALQRYQDKSRQLVDASNRLALAEKDLATVREQLSRRIPRAAQTPTPVAGQPAPGLLSVDGLQFYNTAFGLPAGSGAASTDQPDPEDTAAGAADSGVSREDLLAHIRDVGLWCRTAVAQRDQLLNLLPEPTP